MRISSNSPLVVRVGVYPHRTEQTISWEAGAFADANVRYEFREADAPNLDAVLADADVILVGGGHWSRALIGKLKRCRQLVSCTVGLDHIDLTAAGDAGIEVSNMPDLCTDEVADHTLALILACIRKTSQLNDSVHSGAWDRSLLEPMPRLRGKTLGLFGLGRIGRAVAERAQGFGMLVVASDPFVEASVADSCQVQLRSVIEMCRESDVVSVHTPLTPDTHHAIGREQLAAMKPTAYLINTSRGAIVDEAALVQALEARQIAGAGLDVLEQEPPSGDSPLLRMANVVLTPHAGGFSDEVVDLIPVLAVQTALVALRRLQTQGPAGPS